MTLVKPGVERIDTEERTGLWRERRSLLRYAIDPPTADTFREAYTLPSRQEALLAYLRRLEEVARAVCNGAGITWGDGPWPMDARPAKNTPPAAAIALLKQLHVLRTALATSQRHIEEVRTASSDTLREAALDELNGMIWEIAGDADDVRECFERLAELAIPSPDDPAGRTLVQLVAAAIAAPAKRTKSTPWYITRYRALIDAAIDDARTRGARVRFMDLWKRLDAHDKNTRTAADRRAKPLPTEPAMRSALKNAAAAGILSLPATAPRNQSKR